MKKLNFLLMYFVAALLLVSCSSDDEDDSTVQPDTERPVVTLNRPTDGEKFEPGDRIHADGNITDNVALSQMRIDVHWAGDGHSHGKTSNRWEYVEDIDISGTSWDFHEHITIPDDAEDGKYHFIVYALDAAGNQSEWVEIDIYIEDDHDHGGGGHGHGPELDLTTPNHDGEMDVHGGDVIEIKGMAKDDDHHLKDIHIELIDTDHGDTVVDDVHIHGIDAHTYNIDETVTIPNVNHGHYTLKIEVENDHDEKITKEFKYDVGH